MYKLFMGKAIILPILSVCFIALVMQHAMRMGHTCMCDLSGSTIFFHITS